MNERSMYDDVVVEGEIVETEVETDAPLTGWPAVYVAGEHLPARVPAGGPARVPAGGPARVPAGGPACPAGGPDLDPERRVATPDNALVPVRELSLEDILTRFRAWMRLDVADGKASTETLRVYLMDVRQYLSWLQAAGLSLLQAGEEEVKAYRTFLLQPDTPAYLEPTLPDPPQQYAPSTVARKLGSVRRFYQMAYSRGVMPCNPADGIRAPRDKTARVDKIKAKYLPWFTLKQLLTAPQALPPKKQPKALRDRAVLVLMAVHGLRVIEVHRLDLEDLDFEAGESGALAVFGKGDKWRIVNLTDASREEIKNWLQVRDKLRLGDEPALFVTMSCSPGKRISVRGLRKMVNHYLNVVGVRQQDENGRVIKGRGRSCHALRHSFATHAYAQGAQMSYISKEMGHASEATTEVYRHLVEQERNNPAKFLGGLLE